MHVGLVSDTILCEIVSPGNQVRTFCAPVVLVAGLQHDLQICFERAVSDSYSTLPDALSLVAAL